MTETYTTDWDLASIPDPEFYSEAGRRRGSRSHPKKKKLEPCPGCGVLLGTAERRGACPSCGYWVPGTKLTKKRRQPTQVQPAA